MLLYNKSVLSRDLGLDGVDQIELFSTHLISIQSAVAALGICIVQPAVQLHKPLNILSHLKGPPHLSCYMYSYIDFQLFRTW